MQVQQWRFLMNLDEDDITVYLDQWGIRRLFSLALRRRGAPRRFIDVIAEQLFETLGQHWGAAWKPSKKRLPMRSRDDDAEAEVDVAALSDNETSEGVDVTFQPAQSDDYQEALVSGKSAENLEEAVAKETGPEKAMEEQTTEQKSEPPELQDMFDLDLEEQLLLDQIAEMKTLNYKLRLAPAPKVNRRPCELYIFLPEVCSAACCLHGQLRDAGHVVLARCA